MKKGLYTFGLAILGQLVILLVLIFTHLFVLQTGTDVLLRVEPVDPRDPLRGDYVTFQYEISNVDSFYLGGINLAPRDPSLNVNTVDTVDVLKKKIGQPVYIELGAYGELTPQGRSWTLTDVSEQRPESGVFIEGMIDRVTDTFADHPAQVHVKYGIEDYYIPEGTGRDFNFLNKKIFAHVVVDDHGKPVLKKLYVDGQLWP